MMVRPPSSCCNNPIMNVRNGIRSTDQEEEGQDDDDAAAKILASCILNTGTGNWSTATPRKVVAGLRKCGKSCRQKSKSFSRPDHHLRHQSFTPQEEELIIRLHSAIGSRWLIIAQQLPGRIDNDVKNYWNTKLKKKLAAMGIDPVTHRPYSQILTDYGNMGGGLPRARTGRLIGSLNRDMIKTVVFLSNQEQLPFPSTESFLTPAPSIKMEPPTGEMKTNSIDLLTQLQSITLVKEASNDLSPSSQFHGDFSSSSFSSGSSSSSSSTSSAYCAANDITVSPQGFSWSDFLLEDEFLPGNGQEQENQRPHAEIIATDENPSYEEVLELDMEFPTNDQMLKNKTDSDGSFVDCMLDGDNIDVFLDFPGLLDEPFYC